MQLLSAFDCAKLDNALGGVLDASEKNTYIDYVRDLFWHDSSIQYLRRRGLQLLLLGKDVPVLKERLQHPGHITFSKRRLHVYMVGLFPLHGQLTPLAHKALRTSIEPTPSMLRVRHDEYILEDMLTKSEDAFWEVERYFILSFAVPMALDRRDSRGVWHRVSRSPDELLELHTYVPSFQNRWNDVVTLPLSAVTCMVRGTGTRRVFTPAVAAVKTYLGCLRARDLGYSWAFWRRTNDEALLPVGSILLEFTPFSIYMEILF